MADPSSKIIISSGMILLRRQLAQENSVYIFFSSSGDAGLGSLLQKWRADKN